MKIHSPSCISLHAISQTFFFETEFNCNLLDMLKSVSRAMTDPLDGFMAPPGIRFNFPCCSREDKSLRIVAEETWNSSARSLTFNMPSSSSFFKRYSIRLFISINSFRDRTL